MSDAKAGFATEEWYQAIQEEVDLLLKTSGAASTAVFSLTETYEGAPPRGDGREAGFCLDIRDGRAFVTSGVEPGQQADLVVRGDYQTVAGSLRLLSGPQLDAFYQQAFEGGRLAVNGNDANAPFALSELHDRMCHRTAEATDRSIS